MLQVSCTENTVGGTICKGFLKSVTTFRGRIRKCGTRLPQTSFFERSEGLQVSDEIGGLGFGESVE